MFQVEPVLWLQSIGSPPLTWLLTAVTLLGYTPVYVSAMLVLAFALRLRPSLAIVGGLLLAGILTEAVKNAVEYPRPDEVDGRVKESYAAHPVRLAHPGGAKAFWAPPTAEAIAAVRLRATGDYGFPSGHVAAAAAFLLTTAFFFRSRRALASSALWVPLMALSRMYLGRHFLADVLGGLLVGVAASGLAVLLFRAFDESVFGRHDRRARQAMLPVSVLALALLVVTPYQPLLPPAYVGGLVGLVISYAFLLVTGLPPDGGTARQRLQRVAIGAGLFAVTEGLVHLAGRGSRITSLGGTVIVAVAALAGTVALSRRLGLYAVRTAGE
ncbi:MAG TPA: phosphatase PAP2 family protein [Vicinamibacteria bacterium]|nr:phosphatase PAP2 family protein [Vicinamibacteria bacterium]